MVDVKAKCVGKDVVTTEYCFECIAYITNRVQWLLFSILIQLTVVYYNVTIHLVKRGHTRSTIGGDFKAVLSHRRQMRWDS